MGDDHDEWETDLMCGICGIVHTTRSGRTVDPALLDRMRDTLLHRGPDGAGSFVDGRVGLGHRRLSIVDLAHGQQPMASDDGSIVLVYNGEVYNHRRLREVLETAGHPYHTNCDTESVLRAFIRDGEGAPRELRGMFAFAVWNGRTGELVLVRDRFGVKPLYYLHAPDGSLYFGSEIKAILAAGATNASLNLDVLPDYLANHAPSGEATMFTGVRRLLPGHSLRWREGEVRITQYWDLHFPEAKIADRDERALVEEYGRRFRDAVEMRLMADVPLGMFLSGGIDSAAITATMSSLVAEPVKTFSVAFAEREANELAYARLVANRFRTDHHEVVVDPTDFFGELPRLVWHEDEPIAHPSSVALNFVSRLAAKHVKVVLTGEGSDETLAGYGRYYKTVQNMRLARMYGAVTPGGLREAVRAGVATLPAGARRVLSRTFLALPDSLESLYFENFAVFPTWQQRQILSPAMRDRIGALRPYAEIETLLDAGGPSDLLDRLLYADTKTYLHELLMKQDQMSMAASIESRVPFLDHPLVEFAAALPRRLKLRGSTTKYILREAMKDILPPEILSRRKMGFPVPIGAWLRGPYAGIVEEFVLGDRVRARGMFDMAALQRLVAQHGAGDNHSERLWSLINLEIWQRMHLDGEPVEAIHVR
jgi:asparagine synthase (glutamine-hydrolysing)